MSALLREERAKCLFRFVFGVRLVIVVCLPRLVRGRLTVFGLSATAGSELYWLGLCEIDGVGLDGGVGRSRVAGVGETKAAVAGDGDISSSSEANVSNSSSKAGFF